MRVVIFDRATMTQIGVDRHAQGAKPGDFDIVHHMAADSKGNLYTAEIVNNRRAQRFVPVEPGSYSTRSALSGSAFAACRAGITHASIAIAVSTSTTTAIVKGSVAVTP